MAERLEEELMEDLGYEEAEGASESLEEEFSELDAGEEEAEFGEEWEAGEEGLGEELGEEGVGEFEDYGEEGAELGAEESMEAGLAYALGAEDTDEFFRRLRAGLRRVRGVVGRVARVAAPIARLIPHPAAQIAARGLGLLSNLRAEGACEDEAMDAFAELAAHDESAVPVAAGIAARALIRARGAQLPVPLRRAIVRGVTAAARTLVQNQGPRAVRALPRIVQSVRRTAAIRRTPVRAVPALLRRTAANVARNPRLTARLARPTPAALRRVRPIAAGVPALGRTRPRSVFLRGPVRILITSS